MMMKRDVFPKELEHGVFDSKTKTNLNIEMNCKIMAALEERIITIQPSNNSSVLNMANDC